MKKTLHNKKGFTLAELLIVVAIIAVLVAIAIPIFTAQLEKAREATDAANLRSAYAEVSVAVLDGDGNTTYYKGVEMTQTKDATFTTTGDAAVGGQKLTEIADAKKGVTEYVTVKANGDVTINSAKPTEGTEVK